MSGPRIGAGGVYEWGDNATASKWTLQYQSAVIGEDVDVALANDRISGISLWHFYDFKVDNCGSTWPCHGRPGQERAAPSAHKTHLVTRLFVSMADFRRRTAPTAPTTTRRPPPSRSSAGSARQTAPPSRQPSGPEVQTARACSPFLLLVQPPSFLFRHQPQGRARLLAAAEAGVRDGGGKVPRGEGQAHCLRVCDYCPVTLGRASKVVQSIVLFCFH